MHGQTKERFSCPKCGSENIGCGQEMDREMGPLGEAWWCKDCKHEESNPEPNNWVELVATEDAEAT